MKKFETLFIGISLLALIVVAGGALVLQSQRAGQGAGYKFPETKYGSFLAAQHAVYVNDFESAVQLTSVLEDVDYPIVKSTRFIAEFLGGKMPSDAKLLKNEKSMPSQLIYDAYLIQNDDWKGLYSRHKNDTSALAAPLRIWSSVANDARTSAFKFIETLQTNPSWKAFIRGQIYATQGDVDNAAKNFAQVTPDFMNINDYLYIMSFYTHHNMSEHADALKAEFTRLPGGMFMNDDYKIPDWSIYSGINNALAFSMIQNVSHTQIMMYSDLSVLLLRFAQITAPEYAYSNDAIHYYLGQYFYNNVGDYMRHFAQIKPESPFYLFSTLRIIEKTQDIDTLKKIVDAHPLFVAGVNKLIGYYIQQGQRSAALRVVNKALSQETLDGAGRAFFTKSRAHIHFTFGDFDAAQRDLRSAADVLIADSEILSLQAKVWAAQKRELDNAYDYAITLVSKNPGDVLAWDTLGCVLVVRDGIDAALDVFERVGEVTNSCSTLFEHIGDAYCLRGDSDKARKAYERAIELSDDGLTVVPFVERKIKDLK